MNRQDKHFENQEPKTRNQEPVECLGKTFDSDEARREYFLGLLREGLEELHAKLGGVPFTTVEDAVARLQSLEKWPVGNDQRIRELAERMAEAARHGVSGSQFRVQGSENQEPTTRNQELLSLYKAEVGFPHGEIEDILNLSDPPYYTACPNPFIEDFVKHYGKPYDPNVPYSREPFAADISGSKSTKIYMAHTYHTKVPPESIVPLIQHYTEPGDIILDPFCGSGMAGVAVHYVNSSDNESAPRRAILSDLSPFASFLADRMTHSWGTDFEAALHYLEQLKADLDWLYRRSDGKEIAYAIWSDIWVCSNCGNEDTDWNLTVDEDTLTIKKPVCSQCGAELSRARLPRKKITIVDPINGDVRQISAQQMVRIGIKNGRETLLLPPEKHDVEIINRASRLLSQIYITPLKIPRGANTQQPISSHGYEYAHDFYTPRNLLFISRYIEWAKEKKEYKDLLFLLTSVLVKTASKLHAIGFKGNINLAGQAPNTLQIPSSFAERNLFILLRGKAKDISTVYSYQKIPGAVCVSTNSAGTLDFIPSNSVDYIFTDPPFGANINYSEISFLYEYWLGVFTNNRKEAIVNKYQNKTVSEYEQLMEESLKECRRVLKPGRWITLEFHNSTNAIWTAIQNALGRAGFVSADVRVFDKGQGTWKQMTAGGTVKKDLLISAYKPNGGLEDRFRLTAGTEEGVWDFIRTHLKQLPVFVSKDGKAEVIAERQNYLLFDRMVAFHVQRGVTVPLSAAEFYAGLAQRFPERDGMYFLPEQVAEYDKKRMKVKEVLQLQLFVTDEASAIQWLKQQLTRKPQTFQELHPQFLKEIGGWQKHEKPLELSELLEQNFLRYDGKGPIPAQIVSWMKQSADLRKIIQDELASGRSTEENGQLSPQSSVLIARAKDRWYVPDPNKASDLEKLRERALLREFEEYRESKQKRLKVFRLEAVRAGFKKAWQERDYATIIAVARKIPENVLQEDPKLLMWYDQALTRMGGEV